MADFHKAVRKVLDAEGGYSVHAADRGNYNSRGKLVGTNRGISAPLYEDLLFVVPTAQHMQEISGEEAVAIYMVKFWIPIQGKRIVYQKVADVFLDGAVNHGRGLAVRLMQRAIGAKVDGRVGPQTLGMINSHRDPDQLIRDFLQLRENIYRNDSSSDSFLRGWLARIEKFLNPKTEDHV